MAATSLRNPSTTFHSNGSQVVLCPRLASSMDANVRPYKFVDLKPSFHVKYAVSSPFEGGFYRLGVVVPDIAFMGQGHTAAVRVIAHATDVVTQRVELDVVDTIVDHLGQQLGGFDEDSLGTRLEREKKKVKKEPIWLVQPAACSHHLGCTSGWQQPKNSAIRGASLRDVGTSSSKLVSWLPPPSGYIKINFDGSVHPNSSGLGVVIRDHCGHILLAMAVPLSTSSVSRAELTAAWYGLREAILLFHPTKVILEGNCSTVVSSINGKSKYQHPYLGHLKALISTISRFICLHVYREANQAADFMANWAATRKQMAYWTTNFPPQLLYIVTGDARGDVYLRP